jgi:hypothetical protein
MLDEQNTKQCSPVVSLCECVDSLSEVLMYRCGVLEPFNFLEALSLVGDECLVDTACVCNIEDASSELSTHH